MNIIYRFMIALNVNCHLHPTKIIPICPLNYFTFQPS
uniref:Uncharacterized protein n=1 Tax=Anguilla anguilla TaxID=7936 RepID=A0A0E9V135_ANGAN